MVRQELQAGLAIPLHHLTTGVIVGDALVSGEPPNAIRLVVPQRCATASGVNHALHLRPQEMHEAVRDLPTVPLLPFCQVVAGRPRARIFPRIATPETNMTSGKMFNSKASRQSLAFSRAESKWRRRNVRRLNLSKTQTIRAKRKSELAARYQSTLRFETLRADCEI